MVYVYYETFCDVSIHHFAAMVHRELQNSNKFLGHPIVSKEVPLTTFPDVLTNLKT